MIEYVRTGVILCTKNYHECVEFYSDVLNLPIEKTLDNEHSRLTVFSFGEYSYLMIETGGTAIPNGKTHNQNPVWLRFNVISVDAAARHLMTKGVTVKIRKEVWGTVGDFMDPDGNICSFREVSSDVLNS